MPRDPFHNAIAWLCVGALISIAVLIVTVFAGFRDAMAQSEHQTTWREGDEGSVYAYCMNPVALQSIIESKGRSQRTGRLMTFIEHDECKYFPELVNLTLLGFHDGPFTAIGQNRRWSIWQARTAWGSLVYVAIPDDTGKHEPAVEG